MVNMPAKFHEEENMSAKFDEVAPSSLVSIVFTCLLTYMSIMTLTFDL